MAPILGFGGSGADGGSSYLSATSQELSPSSASITGTTSSSMSDSLPASPPTPDVLERGEHEQQQLQPLQPYTRKISAKNKGSMNGTSSSSSIRRIKSTSSPTSAQQQKQYNILIKYGSLLLLVGQMVGLVLLMRYSRTHSSGDELYLASTAVFMMEVSANIREEDYRCFRGMVLFFACFTFRFFVGIIAVQHCMQILSCLTHSQFLGSLY